MARVLIICPTFSHADALYMSIASVRAQNFEDWQMVVIGDGAPQKTATILEALVAEDDRISYKAFPKSIRYGEEYRDAVIRGSGAEIVCHLSDDDLWAPNHLDTMISLTSKADWVCQAPMRISKAGQVDWWPVNHATPAIRHSVAAFFGVSAGINYVAYRTEAYLRLRQGWSAAPRELGPSDRFNWSKFMDDSSIGIASEAITTALKFPSHTQERSEAKPEERCAELGLWLARVSKPGLVSSLRECGSVGARFQDLFMLHGCWQDDDFEVALARCGMRAVGENVRPLPGGHDTLMSVPLTPDQKESVRSCLAGVNGLAHLADGQPDANAWKKVFGGARHQWLKVMFGVGIDDFEKADELYHAFREPLADSPHYWSTWFVLALRAGQFETASRVLENARLIWPKATWVDLLESRLQSRQ